MPVSGRKISSEVARNGLTWFHTSNILVNDWQESKCILGNPRPPIKPKILSVQVCFQSRPNFIIDRLGPLLLPYPGSKQSQPFFRCVCFSSWSEYPEPSQLRAVCLLYLYIYCTRRLNFGIRLIKLMWRYMSLKYFFFTSISKLQIVGVYVQFDQTL